MIGIIIFMFVFLWTLENTCKGMRQVQEKNRKQRRGR